MTSRVSFFLVSVAMVSRMYAGLEQNWVGDIEHANVTETLRLLQAIEQQSEPAELARNWRLQAYLYRGYFDAAVQRRYLCEQARQADAYTVLGAASTTAGGSLTALLHAADALAGASIPAPAACSPANLSELAGWTAAVYAYAERINGSIGASVLQSQSTDLNLESFSETALSDAPWLSSELARITAIGTEAARLAAITAVMSWAEPAAGGWVDILGSGVLAGLAPRLVPGEGADHDPAFHYTVHQASFDGFGHTPVPVPQRAAWNSFSQTIEASAELKLLYPGLDPAQQYTLTVLFFRTLQAGGHAGGANDELNTLLAGSTTLQTAARSVFPMRPMSFRVPVNETRSGSLVVRCRGASGPDTGSSACSIVAVWLAPSSLPSGSSSVFAP